MGTPVMRSGANRPGGRLIIKSIDQAYGRMGEDDYLADDWEIYHKSVTYPLNRKRKGQE